MNNEAAKVLITLNAIAWLALTALMTALLWVPYVLNRFLKLGVWRTMQNPQGEDEARHAPWAQRAMRAHKNAVENLAVFGVLVLGAAVLGHAEHAGLVLTAQVFFFARLVHFIVYSAGVPGLRTVSFLTGFGAQVTAAWIVLGAA